MTMPGVEKLLQQFIEDDRHAGLVDPEAYLRQVEGADRTSRGRAAGRSTSMRSNTRPRGRWRRSSIASSAA